MGNRGAGGGLSEASEMFGEGSESVRTDGRGIASFFLRVWILSL